MQSSGGTVYYWNPSVHWKYLEGNKIKIGKYIYSGIVKKLFPEFYFRFNEGQTYTDFCNWNKETSEKTLKKIFESFLSNGIITDALCGIREIFDVQYKAMGDHKNIRSYSEVAKIQIEQMGLARKIIAEREQDKQTLPLTYGNRNKSFFFQRRSVRTYDTAKKIPFNLFSELLSVLKIETVKGLNYSTYPSAGGFFSVDVYIYIKENRVEDIPGGFYYYNPYGHRMVHLDNGVIFGMDIHFESNTNIFESSAFSVYLYYNGNVSGPKYKGQAYFYGILEAGMLLQNLALQGVRLGIGSCVIGSTNESEINKRLKVPKNSMYLIEMEMGLIRETL